MADEWGCSKKEMEDIKATERISNLLGALVDALHEGGEDILGQEGVVDLGNEGVQTDVRLLLVGLEETLDTDLVVDCLNGNDVGLIAATVVLLFMLLCLWGSEVERKVEC